MIFPIIDWLILQILLIANEQLSHQYWFIKTFNHASIFKRLYVTNLLSRMLVEAAVDKQSEIACTTRTID